MEEFIEILTNFTNEEMKKIIEKAERKDKLNNYEISLIYHFMKWYEKTNKEIK